MTIYLSVAGLIYTILLSIIFFFKKKVKTFEIKIYSMLIIATLLALTSELFIIVTVYFFDPSFLNFSLKLNLICVLIWMMLLVLYVLNLSHNKLANKKIFWFIYIMSTISFAAIVSVLPIEFYNIDGKAYSYGPAVDFMYDISSLLVFMVVIIIMLDIKNIKRKQYLPVILLVIFLVISAAIQNLHPEILINNFLYAFTVFFMYHTIENPDMKLIEQLNIARDQAEKANNAKTDFLSNMSHEIRTPLNAIVGFSQALLEEDLPGEAKEEVKDIVMASENLLEIVNGILDISKIEANKLEIINTEYQLSKITKELITLTKTRIGEKPIEFRTNFDPSIPEVLYGDHTRLKQIILNILTNAAKYTKEGFVEFKIDSVVKGDICRLIISVEDSGIGIKPEKINSLFSKFDRLGVEEDITIEGTGLGLAITKKLVDLMGGKIVVQSVYGKGSKFTVAIDQKIIATKAPIIQEENEVVKSIDFSGKKILVVDDNKVNLKVAERLLRSYNVDVETVSSGMECLDKINNKEFYDIILMDDMMPKMSGTETFHKLKEIPDFNIPVVALTANAISGMKEKYLNEGFDDYLAKPIQKIELNQVLTKYLK